MPLLRGCFFITECEHTQHRVHFLRKSVWARICSEAMRADQLSHFLPLTAPSAAIQPASTEPNTPVAPSPLPAYACPVRLLPKRKGVRAIANLSKRPRIDSGWTNLGAAGGTTGNPSAAVGAVPVAPSLSRPTSTSTLSINGRLQKLFAVLQYECARAPSLVGSGVLGTDEIFARLRRFVAQLRRHSATPTASINRDNRVAGDAGDGLYFVKVDIRQCYDGIEQAPLFRLVGELLSESE